MTKAAKIVLIARRQIAWLRDMIRAQEQIIALAFTAVIPPPFVVALIHERSNPLGDFNKYRANFPAMPAGTDVTTQAFDLSIDGVAQPTQKLAKEATFAEFEVPQNSSVIVSLKYVDEAGNESQPQTQSFVAVDTIAPNAPGAFGAIELLSERHEDDAPETT